MSERITESGAVLLSSITFKGFLEGTPVYEDRTVHITLKRDHGAHHAILNLPTIQLHCASKTCSGMRFFDPPSESLQLHYPPSYTSYLDDHFLDYTCRNCHSVLKTFAVRIKLEKVGSQGIFRKIGEYPQFGEPRPNAVKEVLDDEVEFFERGYRAEIAGLGIGAFAYYRRFVESHKDKIIAEIRKVAVAQGANDDVLATLDKAASMNSFENAVKTVKDAIPNSLRHTGGHNPLTLLHDALSAGLHNEKDDECLELAKDIRLLLTDLAERTTQALKNNSELSQAVNRLLKKATARGNT